MGGVFLNLELRVGLKTFPTRPSLLKKFTRQKALMMIEYKTAENTQSRPRSIFENLGRRVFVHK